MSSSQPISDEISRGSEFKPQMGCDEGTENPLNEAPLCPLCSQPMQKIAMTFIDGHDFAWHECDLCIMQLGLRRKGQLSQR